MLWLSHWSRGSFGGRNLRETGVLNTELSLLATGVEGMSLGSASVPLSSVLDVRFLSRDPPVLGRQD